MGRRNIDRVPIPAAGDVTFVLVGESRLWPRPKAVSRSNITPGLGTAMSALRHEQRETGEHSRVNELQELPNIRIMLAERASSSVSSNYWERQQCVQLQPVPISASGTGRASALLAIDIAPPCSELRDHSTQLMQPTSLALRDWLSSSLRAKSRGLEDAEPGHVEGRLRSADGCGLRFSRRH